MPAYVQNWPSKLWLVRHGESSGNVARSLAEAGGLAMIDIADRDMDVPLSALGEHQARALGRWFGQKPVQERPSVVLASPYVRAMQTSQLVVAGAGIGVHTALLELADERLREKEFGAFHQLTKAGIRERFPEEAKLRDHVGKFY